MATARITSGRHYCISQKRTFTTVQRRIWGNFINFAEKSGKVL